MAAIGRGKKRVLGANGWMGVIEEEGEGPKEQPTPRYRAWILMAASTMVYVNGAGSHSAREGGDFFCRECGDKKRSGRVERM